jgi:hypothetical protein
MIVQSTYQPSNVIEGDVIKDLSGNCYTYVGSFVGYVPPSGYIVVNDDVFTATTATTYTTCVSCLTPTPTPTPAYKEWVGMAEFTISCPVCELTDYGVPYTFYTSASVSSLTDGTEIYDNMNLTVPTLVTYIKYGNKIYINNDGTITEHCTVNGNC